MAEEPGDDKETLAKAHLPYRAEYCKTSRAKCKKCSEPMEASSLKLANLVKSRFHDGYDANFYHVTCFFQIKRPASVAEIRCFETLKYEDQKILEKAVETEGLSVLGTAVQVPKNSGKVKTEKVAKKKGTKRSKADLDEGTSFLVNYDDFLVEYAKSNRSKCVKCEEKIDKDTIRLGKLDYEADTPWQGGPVPRWYHVDCFIKSVNQLKFFGKIDKIKNFNDLEKEDRKMLKKKVIDQKPPVEFLVDGGKKIKADGVSEEEERQLKKQSDRFYSLREEVGKMKKKDVEEMLSHMRQKFYAKNSSSMIDCATDVLLFGPLAKCPKCKKRGGMELRGSSYICTRGEDWEKCNYETREPERDVPDIPDEIVEKYSFLQDYEFTGGKRIFPTKFVKAVEQKEAEDNNVVQEGAPLEGLTIGVISWAGVKMDKTKIQKKITTLGGKITTALEKSIFVILTNEDELDKETSPKVEVAKALCVPFATPDFLFKITTKEDVVPQLTKCLIGEWEGDLKSRFK